MHVLPAVLLLCVVSIEAATTQQSSISQYGITWFFSKPHTTGQFVNGDYWVLGPINLTDIIPKINGSIHGSQINPSSASSQGLDYRISGFNASLSISSTTLPLPLLIDYPASIVSVQSNPGQGLPLNDCAILTVLLQIPPNDGATVFRPPYSGTVKELFNSNDLKTSLLPSLAPPDLGTSSYSLSLVVNRFQRPWIDWLTDWVGRNLHPKNNMPDYGSDIAIQTNEAALILFLNYSITDKHQALVNYLQYGIDLYGNLKIGTQYYPNGGHMLGRMVPLALAAVLVNSVDIGNQIIAYNFSQMAEYNSVIKGKNGRGLWGQSNTGGEYAYWQNQVIDRNSRTIPDPYGYIDGGYIPGDSYQFCCNSQPFKGIYLISLLLPDLQKFMNDAIFADYVDRWVTFGAWTQPDPCAPHDGNLSNYGKTFGPDGNGGCILDKNSTDGTGRYPQLHGTSADGGYYSSTLVNSMWALYRDSLPAGNSKSPTIASAVFILLIFLSVLL